MTDTANTTATVMREMPSTDGPGSFVTQSSPQWGKWESRGGTFISAPAAVSWGENRLDVFAIATNSQLYHAWWDGSGWQPWENLGGTCIFSPAVVAPVPQRLDVFAIGIDKHVYRKWWDGAQWKGWQDLGGVCIHGVAATSWGENHIELFSVGTNSCLYHKFWNGSTWSSWEALKLKDKMDWEKSSTAICAPAAVSLSRTRTDIFTLGIDSHVYHAWRDGTSEWNGWEDLGGPCIQGVAATSASANRLDVFAIGTDIQGTDNHLYHKIWDGSTWGTWENLGGICIYGAAAAGGKNRLDTFAIGTKNALFQKTWTKDSGGMSADGSMGQKSLINLVLQDEDAQPYANKKYEIWIRGAKFGTSEFRTTANGEIKAEIPPTAEAELRVWYENDADEPEISILEINGLAAINTIQGVQDRLNNLGYSCGDEDGTIGAKTREALKAFQADNNLITTGEIDDITRKTLQNKHDGVAA